jgi:hypothetical protein
MGRQKLLTKIAGRGANAAYPYKMFGFTGRNGAGTIAVTDTGGAAPEVGDIVCSVSRQSGAANETAAFEGKITVAGAIQQSSASNLSANFYFAHVLRKR